MIHVTMTTEYYPLHQLHKDMTEEEWKVEAVRHYRMEYNFDEKTEQECRIVRKNWKALVEVMPEKLKTGVHLVGAEVAFMGENIWVVDGELDHDLHLLCGTCHKHGVLSRNSKVWCTNCDGYRKTVGWQDVEKPG